MNPVNAILGVTVFCLMTIGATSLFSSDLIRLFNTATVDGTGWRIDLRLRPDPGATAVSIDVDAAISYYESLARTWERAAFIRARPVAGDVQIARRFLSQIQPFIWRRTLDYTVMDDMRTMLRRPQQYNGWLGYDLKIGKNGIRQIEFFTHVLQLVAGGREPGLRQHQTASALRALAKFNWITSVQASALITAYNQLRRTEHRIQMLADSQTHSLPRSTSGLTQFANFMGHAESTDLCAALAAVQGSIAKHSEHKILHETDKIFLYWKLFLLIVIFIQLIVFSLLCSSSWDPTVAYMAYMAL